MNQGCHNSGRFGHTKDQCYARGGIKEGQWPRDQGPRQHWRGGRRNETANQANNDDAPLGDVAWQTGMPSFDPLFSKSDWITDTGTSSHIATQCDMFTTFNPEHSHVGGFGEDMGLESMGRGTVSLLTSVDGKPIHTTLQDVLYIPKATNCLLAIGRIDTKGGMAKFSNGKVTISQTDG